MTIVFDKTLDFGDLNSDEPEKALPDGDYEFRCIGAREHKSKSNKYMLILEHVVVGGPEDGRSVTDFVFLVAGNSGDPRGNRQMKAKLREICNACDLSMPKGGSSDNTADAGFSAWCAALIGKEFTAHVSQTANGRMRLSYGSGSMVMRAASTTDY